MASFSATKQLLNQVTTHERSALAVLCLSLKWQSLEQQTLCLARQLQQSGRPVTLVVRAGSPLHAQVQAHDLPYLPLPYRLATAPIQLAIQLSRWLRQESVRLVLTTRTADLALVSSLKRWQARHLRLLHRQLEPLAADNMLIRWWLNQHLPVVNAWLAPLAGLGQEVLTRTTLDGRQLWVVPPPLPPSGTSGAAPDTRTEGRYQLNLPLAPPLIGVFDDGGTAPFFAVEALYRLRHEHDSPAELMVMRSPVTPPDQARWAALWQLVQRLHLEDRVHLRPLTATADASTYYDVLDALLLPDAQCLPVLKAMSSGCPLVCAHTPEAAELLCHGQTALLFPVRDVAACAKQLFVTLSSPAQAHLLAARAVAFVRFHYDPVQQQQHLETILDYVCLPEER